MKKTDIRAGKLLAWDLYKDKNAAAALPEIYHHAESLSETQRGWYWSSIRRKRMAAIGVMFLTLVLLIAGTLLPILAGLHSTVELRLNYTQWGVVALATGGLLQVANRVFGWSSGWLRYMTTVTQMESRSRKFELDWASYILGRSKSITDTDIRPLFDVARQFEIDLLKLQDDETEKWVTEFGNSVALLGDLIKSQRESTEKAADAAKAVLAEQDKADKPGAVEVKLKFKDALVPIDIAFDGGEPEPFNGPSWTKRDVAPGIHDIKVAPRAATEPRVDKIVEVKPATVTVIEIDTGL